MYGSISRAFARLKAAVSITRAANPVALVAQKVVTYEDTAKRRSMGFTLFQGDYFCHPMLLKKRKVPANGLLAL